MLRILIAAACLLPAASSGQWVRREVIHAGRLPIEVERVYDETPVPWRQGMRTSIPPGWWLKYPVVEQGAGWVRVRIPRDDPEHRGHDVHTILTADIGARHVRTTYRVAGSGSRRPLGRPAAAFWCWRR